MRLKIALVIGILCLAVSGFVPTAAWAVPGILPLRTQVLVVGGTPAGIAAAVAAARAGMKTVLIEPREELGGDITGAWLNTFDMNWGPNGEHLTRGIFFEVYRSLGQAFDIDKARAVFDGLVRAEPNLTVMLQIRMVTPILRSGVLLGVAAMDERNHVPVQLLADEIIDATDNASLAVASGVLYTVGREESGMDHRMQAATLIFRLSGVDQGRVEEYIQTYDKPQRRGGMKGRYAWGYSHILRQYQSKNPRVGIYDLNLGWQSDGSVLVNALQIFDVDGTDPASVRDARAMAMAELPDVIDFVRAKAPGFERAVLLGAAPHLYIRETRHIVGLYRMRADDIFESRDFKDRVAIASYPIDLHPYVPGQFNLIRPSRYVYAIPFRALIPLGVDHLMVVGKSMSATYIAYGSLRIVPTQMALGQAAGEAAALAVAMDASPARLAEDARAITVLQTKLTASGAFLPSPRDLSAEAIRPRQPTTTPTPPPRTIRHQSHEVR